MVDSCFFAGNLLYLLQHTLEFLLEVNSMLEKVTANPPATSLGWWHYDVLTLYRYGYNYDCILSIITLFAQLAKQEADLFKCLCNVKPPTSKSLHLIKYLPFKVLREQRCAILCHAGR